MKKIYLCGPINGCTDEESKSWRDLVSVKANGIGCETIDPMRRDYRGRESVNYREIVELDKIDVRTCDVVLVNYEKPSVGTSMEVFFAWSIGKPVVVVCRPETNISPWLRYHSTIILNTFAIAMDWISECIA
jgi:nucleoside 2-deoxyribosyltransferase